MVSEYDGQLSEYQQYGWGISGNNRSIIQASARPIAPSLFSADISCDWQYLIH
jgi:hypothetical protein